MRGEPFAPLNKAKFLRCTHCSPHQPNQTERGDRSRAPSARVGSVAAVRCAHNRQIILANSDHLSIDSRRRWNGSILSVVLLLLAQSPALSTRHPSRYHIHRTHSVWCISCKRHVAVFRCACACGVCRTFENHRQTNGPKRFSAGATMRTKQIRWSQPSYTPNNGRARIM